jgi:O-antigen ligase
MTFKKIFSPTLHLQGFTLFCCCFLLIGLIFSPFVLSLGIWGLAIAAVWNLWLSNASQSDNYRFNFSIFVNIVKTGVVNFYRNKVGFALGLLFFVVLISGLWSSELGYWLDRVRVRIPFLVLPFAFANLTDLSKKHLIGVLYFLSLLMFGTCLFLAARFFINYEAYMELLRVGQSVPVPRNHIRFNLILATTIVVTAWLRSQDFRFRYRWEVILQWVILIFLFGFIHILAVRSGLVALYGAIFIGLLWFVLHSKRWFLGLGALLIFSVIPIIALQKVPSFKQKMAYMRWDYGQYLETKGMGYSDSERIISLKAGWQLFKQHPILGIGTGDLEVEMNRQVKLDFPEYKEAVKLPHNQFAYFLTATGLLGLLVSLFAIYRPMLEARNRNFFLFAVFQWIVFASFLVEYTLETSIGAVFFLFFQLLFMKLSEK